MRRRVLIMGAAGRDFQGLVGGLGFGAALDLEGCPFAFDPRLDGGCAAAVGPVPGGACFCGRHGGPFPVPSPPSRDASPPRD